MPEYRSRQELRTKVVEAFSAQAEVYKVCLFGKEAARKDDQYSDIDLIVYSNDLLKTFHHYQQLFSSISPIIGTYTLGGGQDWFAEMLLLSDYSPYQKIDFSIGFGLDLSLTPVITVYDCPDKNANPVSTLSQVEICYDVAYHLADRLFTIPRFTKCLFRQDIDMYRRWTATMNGVLVLLYEKKFGWQSETRKTKMMPYEMEKLMANLSGEEQQQLYSVCPPDGNVQIPASFLNGMNFFIALSREKAAYFGVELNENLIAYMQTFLDAEIERVQSV